MQGVGKLSVNGQLVWMLVTVGHQVCVTILKCPVVPKSSHGLGKNECEGTQEPRGLCLPKRVGERAVLPLPCPCFCLEKVVNLYLARFPVGKGNVFHSSLVPTDSLLKF